jgi:DNA-binding NarL/FixJ family response regulator
VRVEAAYAAGAADYLPWDVYADELLTAIEGACSRQLRFERAARLEPQPATWARAEV